MSLEKKAKEIRDQCTEVVDTCSDYLNICSEVEDSAAGTLNFPAYSLSCSCSDSTKYREALDKATYYRDIAEHLKIENRKLRVEYSEKIDTVRKFWRNKVLEERSPGGKMPMLNEGR